MAAKSALTGENEFRQLYDELQEKGTNDRAARNAVSRKIAAIALSLLKHKSPDDKARVLSRDKEEAV